MIRTPARKEIKVLTTDNVKVVDGVLYLSGEPPIVAANVSQCQINCVDDGSAEVVKICPAIPTTCECPYIWGVEIHTLPDLTEYNTDNTFRVKKLYEFGNDDGSTPTAAQVAQGIVSQINSDASAPVTAEYDATGCSGNPAIVLTGKSNGHTYEVFVVAGTSSITTAGVADGLTTNKLRKMFPLEHGKFGEIPPATFCSNYCILTAVVKDCCSDASDAADVSMDRANQGMNYEVLWAIPTNVVNGTDADGITIHNLLNDFFTCLSADI